MINIEETSDSIYFGFTLFPCDDNKVPKASHAEENWKDHAFTTIEQVKQSKANMYAIRPSHRGLFALDADRKGEIDGLMTLYNLCYEIGLDPDLIFGRHPCRVLTPSGGFHFYFKTTNMTPIVTNSFYNHIFPAVDTRCGGNGYIIAPGGYNPKYKAFYIMEGSFDDAPEMPKELLDYITSKVCTKEVIQKKSRDDILGCFDLPSEDTLRGQIFASANKKIKNEIESSKIIDFIKQLKNDRYIVVITSDHGNIFCKGNGIKTNRNLEFDIRESRRCLIFDRDTFADEVVNNNPDRTYRYKYAFAPTELIFVLAKSNECFINDKEYAITHGGISPEELIVPMAVIK